MAACGITRRPRPRSRETDFFTSHEALLLPYEEALTRVDSALPATGTTCSAHMLWIGDRTRQPDHAHVEFLRGVNNPLGLKCGPTSDPDELIRLIDIAEPGQRARPHLTLIARMGFEKVQDKLPALIRTVRRRAGSVVWACDPMHGNTIKSSTGYKTRHFDRILSRGEGLLRRSSAPKAPIPAASISRLTGQDVTECIGGARRSPITR